MLHIELFADGGIRLAPPAGRPGIASLAATARWVEVAASQGHPIRITGQVDAPLARAVRERLTAGGAAVDAEATEPRPWRRGWTSLMWAAEHGLVEESADLLERGSSPEVSWWKLSPYRLAMRRGHIPVMELLRAAGAEQPTLSRPPGAANAIVMRPYVSRLFWWSAPVAVLVGLAIAGVMRSLTAAVVGAAVGAFIAALACWANFLSARVSSVAVEGPRLSVRSFGGWRGPVDLRHLAAFGIRRSLHRRMPTLLQLVNDEIGEPLSGQATCPGLDSTDLEQLLKQPQQRVLTVPLRGWNYLQPGLERYVAGFIDADLTLVSSTAGHLFPDAPP
jgi:hypothetical protein